MRQSGIVSMRGYAEEQQGVWRSSVANQQEETVRTLARSHDVDPAVFAHAVADLTKTKTYNYIKEGLGPEAAFVQAQADVRGLNKERYSTQLAFVRDTNPAVGMVMLDLAGHGGVAGNALAEIPPVLAEAIVREAESQGVNPNLALAVMAQESGVPSDAASKAGAAGRMQTMPDTAKASVPEQDVQGGVRHLKQLLQRYDGNEEHALMAYNWGPEEVDAWLKSGKGKNGQSVPEETRKYVPAVLRRATQNDAHSYDIAGMQAVFSPDELLAERSAMERAVSGRMKLQEEALQAQRAKVEKDIYVRAYDKKLTREDVEAARDILTPNDYFKALKLIEGEISLPDKSDPEALISLHLMAVKGDPDLLATADDYLRANRITNSDYSTMVDEGQQWQKPAMKQVDETLRLNRR